MQRNKNAYPLLCFLILLLSNCTLDYNDPDVKAQLADTIPETILYNITQIKVKNGNISSKIEAEKIETFKNKNIMYITKLHYMEIGKTGAIITEGWADQATYYTDTENAEISGNIYFYSREEEAGVRANYLNWDNQKKILTSGSKEKVTVSRDDGSYVEGSGFSTDFKLKEITFSGDVKGIYIDEEQEEKE